MKAAGAFFGLPRELRTRHNMAHVISDREIHFEWPFVPLTMWPVYVAVMSRGAAGHGWESLELKGNRSQHAQHE